ncbi:MAG TPA: hypothetical protein ACFYEK_10465 [Candidatus Wunengus sp. YC60]|uniref:hypothetical protein n=1 Tax=Candidatus Wunengus sp. YC60 TaxID=3367697 RepID=UPI0040294EDE
MSTNTGMVTSTNINNNISFTDDICADGICCFMSIPRKQTHLGMWKTFLKRRNASYGVKLLYTSTQAKDIVYNPCRCLEFYLKEIVSEDGPTLRVLLRCGIFTKGCRPYTCKGFPDKTDSFMHDVLAPCVYNEYIAHENYVQLKYSHVFRLFYAIKDDNKLLGKIFPGYSAEDVREKLNQCKDVVKISAIWNEKPSEYFLLEVPKTKSVLYTSDVHPQIKGVKQAYDLWQGHIEGWLERHYGSKWHDHLESTIEREKDAVKRTK